MAHAASCRSFRTLLILTVLTSIIAYQHILGNLYQSTNEIEQLNSFQLNDQPHDESISQKASTELSQKYNNESLPVDTTVSNIENELYVDTVQLESPGDLSDVLTTSETSVDDSEQQNDVDVDILDTEIEVPSQNQLLNAEETSDVKLKVQVPITATRVSQKKYLIVQSICEGLNVAKTGLAELMYLAKISGRILVEPRISRPIRYKSWERQLNFGYGDPTIYGKNNTLSEFYKLGKAQKFGAQMITFETFMQHMEVYGDQVPKTIEFQFATLPQWHHPVPPACNNLDNEKIPRLPAFQGYYYLFHGLTDIVAVTIPEMLGRWVSLCIPVPIRPVSAADAVILLQLDSNVANIVITSYVARNTFVKIPDFDKIPMIVESWMYTGRLYEKAMSIAGTPDYAAFHFRVIKLWNKTYPNSRKCAQYLLYTIGEQLRERGIKSIYIATDLVVEEDQNNKIMKPFIDLIARLADKFHVITTLDRKNVDRDFVDQILCAKSKLFFYTSGESPGPNKCTSWSSHYTAFILSNRPAGALAVNLAPLM